jgi:hypothetical protein
MLATTPTQLAVHIYRARRQFSEAGVTEAAVPKLAITVA